ncbi:RDD family protein [Flavobacterium sp.]|uniref:RDD family protein n=1 Tax=Flavobacterium sp. TaxID=239 RepID=UPI00262641F6|nr:RDD family protein [Flavobacterium sp.]MDD3003813.1 RDD family protein [Flavobacterium sp.]
MSELTINTTQNVTINFTAASIGHRILAFGIDLLIMMAYLTSVFLFLSYSGLEYKIQLMDTWSQIAIRSIIFLPVMFYSLIFETFFEGQSLGKKVVRIKVVKIEGYQASFGDYLIRWLFRLVDIVITSGILGFIFIIVSKKYQRLGDMAAGTSVITLRNDVNISSTILEEISYDYKPTYPLVIKLSDNDIRIIKDKFIKAKARRDEELVLKLVSKIEEVTGIKNQSPNNWSFISTVLKDYNYYTQSM